jgi:hypothetical protein
MRSPLIALSAIGLTAPLAPAVVITPVVDTMISSATPDGSFGASGGLAVSAAALPKGEFQSLLRFNTASAKSSFDATFGPGNWQLSSATLSLTSASPTNPKFNSPSAPGLFAITWTANDAWLEGTGNPTTPGSDGLSFNTRSTAIDPAADHLLNTFSFPGGTSGTNTYVLPLDPIFSSDILTGSPLSLCLSPADPTVTFVFNSSNFAASSTWPSLTLTATPVPEPTSLVLAPLAVLPLRRRHRSN